MVKLPDAIELIGKAKGGDRTAFDRLFSNAQDQLVNFIRSRMGPALRQRLDPEDVLQETFLRAFRSMAQFEWKGEESFERWLEGIAGHTLADAARNSRGRKELQIGRDPAAETVSPSKHLRREERFGRLRKSLQGLSPDHQTVIMLSRIEGLTIKEIAGRMERSESAVKNLLFRAMKELKKSFGDTESFHLGSQTFRKEDGRHGA
ncbi:MAG: sigma-70 family RNA polymerase sigma factor [Planctomycetes bacterium]|nr:sigma-70 family RNA polymerase sigma factor [Planctomycetota bacterium]